MGTDINLFREKRLDGRWLSIDHWEGGDAAFALHFRKRNYPLFGLLAKGIRYGFPYAFEPRGLPLTLSDEVARAIATAGSEAHTHSYLYLHELREMKVYLDEMGQGLDAGIIKVAGRMNAEELNVLLKSMASSEPAWQILSPYRALERTGSATAPFELDIPAAFYMRTGLSTIIQSFEGVSGDNQRIVFFFDS